MTTHVKVVFFFHETFIRYEIVEQLVSFAAVIGMSRNALFGGALCDIQKETANETIQSINQSITLLMCQVDLAYIYEQ